ncbi:MAG: energy transducer TonB [Caldimicrobium sp.]
MKMDLSDKQKLICIAFSVLLHSFVLALTLSNVSLKNSNEVKIFILDDAPVAKFETFSGNPKSKKNQKEKTKIDGREIIKDIPKEMPRELPKEIDKEPQGAEKASNAAKVIKETDKGELSEEKVPSLGKANEVTPSKGESLFLSKTQSSSGAFPGTSLKASPGAFSGDEKGTSKMLENVIFGSEHAPRFLHKEFPKYPFIARRLGKEGKVVLRLTIDEKGKLTEIEVLEGAGYGFTEAAIEAVKKSTFLPAYINGTPVKAKAILTINFVLRKE